MPGATKPELRELRAANSEAQAALLAAAIGADLGAALALRPYASLVVSGGRTPALMFAHLARQALDWPRVQITLADERWVAVADPASNESLVRGSLLRERAAAARFIGMKNDAATPAEGAARAWSSIAAMPQPFDVVVLGMGDDAHTASLFPGSAGLSAALDPGVPPGCVAMDPQGAPHPRLSLNLAALLHSRRICLQISGAYKWRVYQRALAAGPIGDLPVRAILQQGTVPVDVYWCPDAPSGGAP